MHANIVQSLITNTQEVCEKMMNISAAPGDKVPCSAIPDDSNASVMTMHAGGADKGYIAIHVSDAIAAAMESGMLGREVEQDGHGAVDTVNEVLNIITGRVKNILIKEIPGIEFSFPQSVAASGAAIPRGDDCTVIPFEVSQGLFYMEMGA